MIQKHARKKFRAKLLYLNRKARFGDHRETVQETEIQEVAVTVVAEAVTSDAMTVETTENPAITTGTK